MRTTLIVAMAWILAAVPATAEEHLEHEAEEQEHEEREDWNEREHAEREEPLDRNVRLEFKVVPLENEDREVFLVAASPGFHHRTEYEGEGVRVEFEVSGRIEIRENGHIFLIFESALAYEGANESAVFHVESSIVMEPGDTVEVASMGDKNLVIYANYAE
jgi:hypothetical protein